MDNTQNIMTHCCHGTLYQNCVFGCKLWEYTRTYRKHYITDEDYTSYEDGLYWNLWVITDAGGCYCIAGKNGYDLYHKGKKIKHGKTVKELKIFVTEWSRSRRGKLL